MIGIVLCGGESSRMGSDKGLLQKNDLTWAQHAFSKLSFLQIPVFISVNKKQVDAYLEYFRLNQLVIDDESISVGGPLLGLLSVHQQFYNEDLLVLACDMIDMKEPIIQNLFDHYKKESFEAYVYEIDGKAQPLCTIYTSNGLSKINSLYSQGQLKKYSMMYALDCINTKFIPVHESSIHVFNNCNAPEDLALRSFSRRNA